MENSTIKYSTKTSNSPKKLYSLAIRTGFYTTAFAVAVKLFFEQPPFALLLLQYLIVAWMLGVFFKSRESFKKNGHIRFRQGFVSGAIFIFIAALTQIGLEAIIYQITPEATFYDKFGFQKLNSDISRAAIFGASFLEYFVLGNTIVFIWLQYLKAPQRFSKQEKLSEQA